MENTLVVATDLSPRSDLAVERAVQLARQQGWDLWLLHVISHRLAGMAHGNYNNPGLNADESALAARRQLLEMAEAIQNRSSGLKVGTDTLIGHASSRIADFAATRRPDLLVVGERGRNWVRDTILLGGTALKVVSEARIPVLLVRRPATANYSKVLVATDFSPSSANAARLALTYFPDTEATLVHAYATKVEERVGYGSDVELASSPARGKVSDLARDAMEAFIASICPRQAAVRNRLVFDYPAQAILSEASESQADLIVIGRHGGGPAGERLLGSVTQHVLYYAGCDVLVVP